MSVGLGDVTESKLEEECLCGQVDLENLYPDRHTNLPSLLDHSQHTFTTNSLSLVLGEKE